ncbi:MAG: glutamate dehydrogenase, partial [Planctomycetota bacterium]
EMLAQRGETFEGKTVAISGYGNLGYHALEKLHELGAKVVTIADEEHFVYEPDGFVGEKQDYVRDLWQVRREHVEEYANHWGVELHKGHPWSVPCDVAMPTAAQNELNEEHARTLIENGCKFVVEGANMPCTPEAIGVFHEAGVPLAPGKAANAGGVAVSGLEMTQNSMRMRWSRDEVDRRLREIMKRIHDVCLDTAAEYGRPGDYSAGANIAGFLRVASAMHAQGVV